MPHVTEDEDDFIGSARVADLFTRSAFSSWLTNDRCKKLKMDVLLFLREILTACHRRSRGETRRYQG